MPRPRVALPATASETRVRHPRPRVVPPAWLRMLTRPWARRLRPHAVPPAIQSRPRGRCPQPC
eukprot:10438549-Alexandrium_andersonii.AAC.1